MIPLSNVAWLLLVVSLPTGSAAARMRVWRGLKVQGCVALRDGAYLLPEAPGREESLRALGDECIRESGAAWLLSVAPRSQEEAQVFQGLFERAAEYAELQANWKTVRQDMARLSAAELVRLQRKLQREFDSLQAIDFFPGEASTEAMAAWQELQARIQQQLSPDEPHEIEGGIARLDATQYQGRTWATRRRLWVDRVASAWLIRRFIDPSARFLWLTTPTDCPAQALGFDFDGAAFSHVAERVTFETLMASFGLEGDAALLRLAAMVHQLDVGGESVAEAAGFEAVLAGARERLDGDDALLQEIGAMLDSLYAHFERQAAKDKG